MTSEGDVPLHPGGEVEYSFRMFATCSRPMAYPIFHPNVVECVFSKNSPQDPFDPAWSLRIRLGAVRSIEEVKECCNAIKDGIFDQLSFVLNIKIDQIGTPRPSLQAVPGGGGQLHAILPMPKFEATGRSGGRPLLEVETEMLGRVLSKSPGNKISPFISLYRSALALDEPVVKFLMLYLILYEISGNQDQKSVDKLIKHHAPSTTDSPNIRPNRSGVLTTYHETPFTRLRNEITHRIGVTPEQNRAEIISNLDAFQDIVHKVLSQHI